MNFDEKKLAFVYNLRKANVTDKRLLTVMEALPREHFINNAFKSLVLENISLPIDCGQTMSQPSVIGIMIQSLRITRRCKILEIGTGSGYQTSILAKLGRRVYSVERFCHLASLAKKSIAELSIANVTVIYGDGTMGLQEQAPFDKIIVSAAVEDIPHCLLMQLKTNGILVAPVGQSEQIQTLVQVEKKINSTEYTDLKKVKFLPIIEGKDNSNIHPTINPE